GAGACLRSHAPYRTTARAFRLRDSRASRRERDLAPGENLLPRRRDLRDPRVPPAGRVQPLRDPQAHTVRGEGNAAGVEETPASQLLIAAVRAPWYSHLKNSNPMVV